MSALCFVCVSTRLNNDLGEKREKNCNKRVGCGERVVGYFFFHSLHLILCEAARIAAAAALFSILRERRDGGVDDVISDESV